MQCVWEFPDSCRCQERAGDSVILCRPHQLRNKSGSNPGIRRYWRGSKALPRPRDRQHLDNHGDRFAMVGEGWVAV
jgi:hypothetical protein